MRLSDYRTIGLSDYWTIGLLDHWTIVAPYVVQRYIALMPRDELSKGSAEFLVLALLENEARHGYELSKLITARSKGALRFNVASLYPLLYRLERRGWVQGRWVERAGQRRRRYYALTTLGRKILRAQRRTWTSFVEGVRRVVGPEYA